MDRLAIVEEHVRLENAHDLDGVMGTFGAQARYDDEPWGEHHMGRTGVRSYYETLFRAAPDLRIDVHKRHVTDEAVVLEVVISGTHRGAWRGLPPTGRRLEFPLCGVFTFGDDGRLAGERIYYDRATVLRQLGVFREPATLWGRLLMPLAHPITVARALLRREDRARAGTK
jgi:steroid delta-isomerase-like uncharacterized protein